jgi:hypothetical protein
MPECSCWSAGVARGYDGSGLRPRASEVLQLICYTLFSKGLWKSCRENTDVASCVSAFHRTAAHRRYGQERFFAPERLDELFRKTAVGQYERDLLFSSVVELMHLVVLGAEPSVFAAFRRRQHQLPVTDDSIYNKLKGMELGVSQAVVRDSASHAFLTPDGHASERTLLDDVLEIVRKNELWIADRNFCTFKFLFGIADKQAFFLIRQHGSIQGRLKGNRRFVGDSPTGKVYEQAIELTHGDETRTVRRITVGLLQPTRDGEVVLHLFTNLPAEVAAVLCGELYRHRWSIETLFYEVTQTLECEIETMCYPAAALFAFCLALMAANAVAVLKAALRATHGEKEANEMSAYYMTLEIKQVYEGMMIALPADEWTSFRTMTVATFAAGLKKMAAHMDLGYYRKSKRGPKKPTPTMDRYRNGGHVSTYKLLKAKDP